MPSGALTSVICAPCEFLNMIKSSCQFFALSPCSWWRWPEVNRLVALIINNRSGMSLLQRRWYFGKVPYSDKPELSAATEAAFYFSCFASAGLNTFEMAPRSGWWWWRRWGCLMKPLTYIQIRLQDQVGYDDMVIFADVMAMVIWWASQTVRWWHLQLKALCLPINSVDFQVQPSHPWAIFRFREWQR